MITILASTKSSAKKIEIAIPSKGETRIFRIVAPEIAMISSRLKSLTPKAPKEEPKQNWVPPEPSVYKLSPRNPQALTKLQSLAKGRKGTLLTPSGERFLPRKLTLEDNFEEVLVQLPADQLSLFLEDLTSLGHLTLVHFQPDEPDKAGRISVQIQVLYAT